MRYSEIEVQSLHKCGTCVQEKIFFYLCKVLNFRHYKGSIISQGDFKLEPPYLMTKRSITGITLDKDKYLAILIVRHPLDRLISQYFSFGFTHCTEAVWIKDRSQRKETSQKMAKRKKETSSQTLDEYVKNNLHDREEEYKIAYNLFKSGDGLVIPYELMVFDFKKFCEIVCKKLEVSCSDLLYKTFQKEFAPKKDLSQMILKRKSKSHVRTLQQDEYLNKLDTLTIEKAKHEIGYLLESYQELKDHYCK